MSLFSLDSKPDPPICINQLAEKDIWSPNVYPYIGALDTPIGQRSSIKKRSVLRLKQRQREPFFRKEAAHGCANSDAA